MAGSGGENGDVLKRNFVGDKNPAREDFRQGTDAAGADFLPSQLLHAGDAGLNDEIEGGLVGHGEDDANIGAAYRGADGGTRG